MSDSDKKFSISPKRHSEQARRSRSSSPDIEGNDDEYKIEEININLTGIDGKYSWLVVFCSFFCNMIVDGMQYTFSNFMEPIMYTFDSTSMTVSLIGSLLSGFYNFSGPLAGALANKFGFRMVVITGSIISAFGLGISYFATSVGMLYFLYGIVGGLGFGMIYMAAVITTSLYFDKYRALATSISVCGTGIGTFVFSPLGNYLVTNYGWRMALVAEAGIVLSCILFGLAFKPLDIVTVSTAGRADDSSGFNISTTTIRTIKTLRGESVVVTHEPQKPLPNEAYPTLKQALLLQDDEIRSDHQKSVAPSGVFSLGQSLVIARSDLSKRYSEDDSEEDETLDPAARKRRNCRRMCRTCCFRFWTCHCKEKRELTVGDRPMYRDDVFYEGSLTLIRSKREIKTDPVDYHLSVIRLPDEKDAAEHRRQKCCGCHEAMIRTIVTMTGLNLLKNTTFLFLCIASFLFTMGVFIPYIFLRALAERKNIKEEQSIWLVSSIGIANTVGRLVSGVVLSCIRLNAALLVVGCTILSGLICLAVFMPIVVESVFTFAVCFGFFTAPFVSLRPVVLVEFLGLEKLTNAFGLVLLSQGVASIIGPPVAGLIEESTGEINYAILFSGALLFISATSVLMSVLLVQKNKKQQRA